MNDDSLFLSTNQATVKEERGTRNDERGTRRRLAWSFVSIASVTVRTKRVSHFFHSSLPVMLKIRKKYFTLRTYLEAWDVSGFVRLFYILSKNKIFRIFGRHILDFWSIMCRFS